MRCPVACRRWGEMGLISSALQRFRNRPRVRRVDAYLPLSSVRVIKPNGCSGGMEPRKARLTLNQLPYSSSGKTRLMVPFVWSVHPRLKVQGE
jgi:hypothetical protein